MTDQEKLSLCKYYKGESKSLYEQGSVPDMFWSLERQYYFSKQDYDLYNNRAKQYIKENKDVENFLTSNAPIEQKGFVLFAEDMIMKWDPYANLDIIFKYGEE